MSTPSPDIRRPLADWLDEPWVFLRSHRAFLLPTFIFCVSLQLALSVGSVAVQTGGLMDNEALAQGNLSSIGVLILISLGSFALLAVVELSSTASLLAAERGETLTGPQAIAAGLTTAGITMVLARWAFQLGMAAFTAVTCGLGGLVWLTAMLYLPLTTPVALREGIGGFDAIRRSFDLIRRRRGGLPSGGSLDRVVVGVHVYYGLIYALSAVPSVGTIVWGALAGYRAVSGGAGAFDPVALQTAAQAPLWISMPTVAVNTLLMLVVIFYGNKLFLDLHTDTAQAERGDDLLKAVDTRSRRGCVPESPPVPDASTVSRLTSAGIDQGEAVNLADWWSAAFDWVASILGDSDLPVELGFGIWAMKGVGVVAAGVGVWLLLRQLRMPRWLQEVPVELGQTQPLPPTIQPGAALTTAIANNDYEAIVAESWRLTEHKLDAENRLEVREDRSAYEATRELRRRHPDWPTTATIEGLAHTYTQLRYGPGPGSIPAALALAERARDLDLPARA